ncbi:MAG: hypothetical protein VXY96_02605 [Pseudomonadota bacterium]|nr:hypothetical protein [Pseudomonadota bacterium]
MKTKLLTICLLLITSQVFAEEYLQEDYIDDKWTVKVITEKSSPTRIYASVNGKISHGDRLNVVISIKDMESCNVGNTTTTFHTMIENEKISKISNLIIPAVFKEDKINIMALFSINNELLKGYVVWMHMGWNSLENIEKYFQNTSEVSLKLVSNDNININEYFDIPENIFSLNGLKDSLDRAKKECYRIVQNKK